MENLVISQHSCSKFLDVATLDLNDSVLFFCWEPNLENLYLSNKHSVYELNIASKSVSPIFSLCNVIKNLSSDSQIVGLAYLSSLESLCIAVSSGELFTLERNFSGAYQEQLVASAISIKLMEWSPSQDTVAVLTNDHQLLVMSAEFDLISELDIQTVKASEEFMSVGWGKEETQFKGSVGKKALNDISAEDLKSVNVSTNESLISWRGDGQLFSVSFVKEENQTRCVSVFNRDGELLFSNAAIQGLENCLSWRPSGSVVALTQRLPNKHSVCFVEKNALKHSTFDLPFAVNQVRVKQLCWSADSKVLLVWCAPLVPSKEENSQAYFADSSCECFLLFSSYNYHWYLKQRMDFSGRNVPVSAAWDIMSDCRLHVFSKAGRYDRYDFKWVVNDSQGLDAADGAYVALVDNGRLNLTCFRFSVIPPPMCSVGVPLASTPYQVLFAPASISAPPPDASLNRGPPPRGTESFGANPNDICAILADGSIATLSYLSLDKFDVAVSRVEWECKEERPVQNCHHWVWASADTLFCFNTEDKDSCAYVVNIRNTEERQFVFTRRCVVDGAVVAAAAKGDGSALVQLQDGQIVSVSVDGAVTPLDRLPDVCRQLAVWQNRTFGLSSRCRLYIDGQLAGDNVTSLAFHSRFFLLTTSRQKLLTCRFTDGPLMGMLTEGQISGAEVTERRVERGTRLVHAIAEDTRVVLSLPRGNLECIHPRGLTLDVLVRSLESQHFRETFQLARKQRINLNIIVDHNPTAFFENVDSFVAKISDADWLSLFLSELRDEDVTTTMYQAHYKQPRPLAVTDKVNRVCTAVREALRKHPEKEKLVLPIISSYVHTKTQAGLESALAVVKDLKQQEETAVPAVTWKAALRHILYLTNVDQLLQTALGMYDFDLVLLVASKSDKDPKEYLAFLNELNKMDTVYQRFSIDKHLQRWKSALKHLVMTGPANKDEFLQFVKEHNLYNEALKHIFPADERYGGLLKGCAEYLTEERLYDEAAIVRRQMGDHRNAFECHKVSLAWKECILDICNVTEGEEFKRAMYNSLIFALMGAKMYVEAAHIHEYYLQEPEKAVSLLITGRAWQEALRVAHLTKNAALIDSIRAKVDDHATNLLTQISLSEGVFVQRESRLRVVREEKLAKWNNSKGGGDGALREDCDLFSDTSSVSGSSFSSTGSTAGTGSTNSRSSCSSKRSRKHERKNLNLKEGNPHEEGALVYALHSNITSAFALRDEVKETCTALIGFRMVSTAVPLQEALASYLALIKSKLKTIWPPRQNHTAEMGPNPYDAMANLEPLQQFAPTIAVRHWELSLLKEDQVK